MNAIERVTQELARVRSGALGTGAIILFVAACGAGPGSPRFSRHVAWSHAEHASGAETNPFPSDRGPVPAMPTAKASSIAGAPGALTVAEDDVTAAGAATAAPPRPAPSGTLVLYDDTGPYAWLGELYGIAAVNLASRFGTWTAKPASTYAKGDVAGHRATIYVGSTYDQALPVDFLDDVATGARPVIWMYNNIWQLARRIPDFASRYGFVPWRYDTSAVAQVQYKGHVLSRYPDNGGGIMQHSPFDPTRATVLASAVRADGTTLPWAVRAQNLTYIGEIPFAYIGSDDRYLAFCDLLFDALQPTAPERHRALLRIEDVSPETDPAALDAIGKLLISEGVPFSIAFISVFTDPHGVYYDGQPTTLHLADNPALLKVIQSLVTQGANLVMHGYTHQYSDVANPYTGASADDFEFFRAHIDTANNVIYDGPVSEDAPAWALGRIDASLAELATSGLSAPTVFEYPHYAGSAADSRALAKRFSTAYHRGLYFGGALSGQPDDLAHSIGQFFPYAVTDLFGWRIIPENIGNYEPEPYNNHPARLVPDLISAAQANLVVRDGVASFYFHPYYDVSVLRQLVDGIRAAGYTFIAPSSL